MGYRVTVEMGYSVKRVEVSEAEALLPDIWQRNLQISGDPRQRFDWVYRQNPSGAGATFLIEHAAEDGTKSVVGSTGVLARSFCVNGQAVNAGILGDVAVHQGHRTLFPALMLQRAARDYANESLGLLYGFPNELAQPLYKRLGFHELGQMVRYGRPLGLEHYVRHRAEFPALLGDVARIVDRGWRELDALRSSLPGREQALQWTEQIDGRFDDLWARARSSHRIIGCRSSEFLRWRFASKPDERFRFITLTRQTLEAYAVIQNQHDVAHIRDLFGSSPAAVDSLLGGLMPLLRMQGVGALSIRFLGEPWLVSLLQHHGFRPREANWPVIVEPCSHLGVAPEVARDPSHWYLMDGDEDM